jgi:chemosensory pili system protein ChpA (sensor histidine kinase/response regulator)
MIRNTEERPIGAFAAEFAATLPGIDAALDALERTPAELAPAREAYRLCHAIKGAASMVGLAALGYSLNQAEELLDPETAILTLDVVRALRGTVPLFSAYMEAGLAGEPVAPAAMNLAAALRRCGAAADDLVLVELVEADAREFAAWRSDPAPATPSGAPALEALLDLSTFSDGLFDLVKPAPPAPPPAPPSGTVPVVAPPPMVVALASPPAPAPAAAPAEVLEDADTIDPELAEIFAEEAQEHLEAIARLTKLLSPVSTDRQGLQDLRRAVHTLKGAAGVVGYMTVSRLAHRMEDRLDALYEQEESPTPEIIHLLTASSDTLHDLLTGSPAPSAARAETVRQLFARFDAMGPAAPGGAIDPASAAGDWPAAAPIALDVAAPPAAGERPSVALIPERSPDATPPPAFNERRRRTDRRGDGRRDGDQMLRVPVARVDELVRFMTELVINRSTFEQHYAALAGQVEELKLSNARLRRVAQKLETDYEARALGGNLIGRRGDQRTATNAASAEGFDELEFDRYTEFHLLTRELAETASDIATVGTRVGDALGDFDSDLTRLGRVTRDIQDKVMEFRMVPLKTLASRLERAVRVAAEACGKSVEFVLEGEHVSMDKSLLQEMADPLMHLLRNAVDHGIETPADRQARGKAGTGRVTVRAYHEGTEVVLEVADDGRGLDLSRIRRTAVDRGYVQEAEAAGLDEESLASFLFEPGFSTASRITEISGRGVGMDIVKGKVVQLNGRINVQTRPGAGATWIVRLPMTLAITRILLFRVGGEIMGLPLGAIVQIVRPLPGAIVPLGSDRVISLSGQTYPVRDLADWLAIPRAAKVGNAPRPLVVATLGGRHVALEIDEILSSRDAVIKTLGTHLRRVQGVWGATLLGDGTAVLILNPADLGGVADAPRPRVAARAVAPDKEPYQILIVDDSLSMRHVLSAAVRRAGWTAIQARDGLEALEAVHRSTRPPDLILLDIEMPRMDGFEFLATIRGQKGFATLPIVMLTSRGGEKHRDKAQSLGATDYLVKPFQEDTLIERVGRLVQARRQTERRVAS